MTAWTPAEDALLREARSHGKTYEETAEIISRSSSSISQRIRRLGIKPGPASNLLWNPEAIATLRLLAPTHTSAEIAVTVQRSVRAVRHKRLALGINIKSGRNVPVPEKRTPPHFTPPVIHIHTGQTGDAQRYLQRARYVVYRCDEDGRQRQDGGFWRCGRHVIDDAALVAKADALKALEQLRAA